MPKAQSNKTMKKPSPKISMKAIYILERNLQSPNLKEAEKNRRETEKKQKKTAGNFRHSYTEAEKNGGKTKREKDSREP